LLFLPEIYGVDLPYVSWEKCF